MHSHHDNLFQARRLQCQADQPGIGSDGHLDLDEILLHDRRFAVHPRHQPVGRLCGTQLAGCLFQRVLRTGNVEPRAWHDHAIGCCCNPDIRREHRRQLFDRLS